MLTRENNFCPSLCVTHNCNLSCIYCYQKHDTNNVMNYSTAINAINWILDNVPSDKNSIVITFIGGEPLLEFELIRKVFYYVKSKKNKIPIKFYASTNGTILSKDMKNWFSQHKNEFVLGLSLDGSREIHNHNRSNSFDLIDIEFFKKNWPNQGIKMTLSDFSLSSLADNIIYLHKLGFKKIDGVNLFEGKFNWNQEQYITEIICQLEKLVDFYVENPGIQLNQMLNRRIELCAMNRKNKKKWCGIGSNMIFFDTDGKRYPCAFTTPMTFSKQDLEMIQKTDFSKDDNFVDEECFNNCYIYPICPTCSGCNYLINKDFKIRDKSKCHINKIIALFIADLQAKRIENGTFSNKNSSILWYTIESIKQIRKLYLDEYADYLS